MNRSVGVLVFVCLLTTYSQVRGQDSDDDDDVTQSPQHHTRHHHRQQQHRGSAISRQQWINRERKRQMRLFNIQRVIMERVGFDRPPNVSAMNQSLSAERLRSMTIRRHQRADSAAAAARLPANYLAQRIIALLPVCNASETRPSSRDDGVVDNGGGAGGSAGLTLEFNLAAINRRPDRQTRLVAATLNLWKRLTRADNGRTLSSRRRWRRPRRHSRTAHNDNTTVSTDTETGRRRAARSPLSYLRRRRPSALTHARALRLTVFSTTSPGRQSTALVRGGHVGWVSVNVNSSVTDRLQSMQAGGDSHQFGLRVVVSDARTRTQINPLHVFQSPSCMHRHQQPSQRADAEPYLELVTVDLPRRPTRRPVAVTSRAPVARLRNASLHSF